MVQGNRLSYGDININTSSALCLGLENEIQAAEHCEPPGENSCTMQKPILNFTSPTSGLLRPRTNVHDIDIISSRFPPTPLRLQQKLFLHQKS